MGKKSLTNVRSLLELIDKAPTTVLKSFSELPECVGLVRGFDWALSDDQFPAALVAHVKHLRKEQRDTAEREALRILRLASPRGATILSTAANQLPDGDLIETFLSQDGGEIGRSVWMRTHSGESARLFDAAESVLNTGDLYGVKRMHDAFDVPCDEAPPFLWNDAVKKALEVQLTKAMRLAEPCEIIHIEMVDDNGHDKIQTAHYLVVRFAGEQVSAVQVINRHRQSFCYFPARDATLVYAPHRKMVEVCARTMSTQALMANVLSKHGFKVPLSNRPLGRSRYDLSRFTRPLKGEKPRLHGAKVERLYLIEAKALLGHATDAVTLHIDSGADLHEVIGPQWANHPFVHAGAILGVTLVADLVFEGETVETPLSIVLAEPGRCSLSGEKDQRLRQAGMQLLEALGVCQPLHPGAGMGDPRLIWQVAKLLECATSPMDGFALAQLGIDIDRFEDEGIITEGERITEKIIELAEGERFPVKLERCTDPNQVCYQDPLTGTKVYLPLKHARRWTVHLDWLREEIITALGTALKGVRGKSLEEEPVFLGVLDMEGDSVAVYFAAKMSSERHFAKIDRALRLRPRSVPGIVLTTASIPFPFAGTNVVISIEDVLSSIGADSVIDLARLKVAYQHGQLAAMGGTMVSLNVSDDGYSAMLLLPGRAPWKVTNQAKITVLQRLVDAYTKGTPHVNTKKLMEDTGCVSPANLFSKSSPWRDYLERVKGAHAWQLNLPTRYEPIEEVDTPDVVAELVEEV